MSGKRQPSALSSRLWKFGVFLIIIKACIGKNTLPQRRAISLQYRFYGGATNQCNYSDEKRRNEMSYSDHFYNYLNFFASLVISRCAND